LIIEKQLYSAHHTTHLSQIVSEGRAGVRPSRA
jgi:hypothetical protein